VWIWFGDCIDPQICIFFFSSDGKQGVDQAGSPS
jgi:hypothetical protein